MGNDAGFDETIGGTVASPFTPVGLSPWPLAIAVASMVTAGGVIALSFHQGFTILAIGLLSFLAVVAFWARDALNDGPNLIRAGAIPQMSFRYGVTLFIVAELMLFVGFFWAYFTFFFFPAKMGIGHAAVWPPAHIQTINPLGEPLFATLVMLLSSTTLTGSFDGILQGNRLNAALGMAATALLATVFLGGQIYEFANLPFPIYHGGIYSSLFLILTSFDMLHVIMGVILLTFCFVRITRGAFTPERYAGFQTIAWYWNFVDVLWLFMFVAVYWIGASAVTAS
ncbi:MAG: cytochrome c oxidase subunit 3 [Acidiphilium sp.]|nr:cytochrome c oxidase subunit 3 [Acidiphilium sp.]MDD4936685.1 cytochrome c oxidase subunit 3 [Acidiphilium sp.]